MGARIYVSGRRFKSDAALPPRRRQPRGAMALVLGMVVLAGALGSLLRSTTSTPADAQSQPAMSAQSTPKMEWSARAEVPWRREWASSSCASDTRIKRARSPRLTGRWSYRLEVRDGDDSYGERCELGQGNPTRPDFPLFAEGQERWISLAVFLPRSYPMPDNWNIFAQLKGLGSGGPPLALEARRGRFALAASTDSVQENVRTRRLWSGPAVRGRWTRFTLHVKFSPDPAVGFVELFAGPGSGRQRQLLRKVSTYTMKRDSTGIAVPSHSRIGPYRDPQISGTARLYFDDYVVSRSAPGEMAMATSKPDQSSH